MFKVNVVGRGAFGSFILDKVNEHPFIKQSDDADTVLLCIPFSAYREVTQEYKDKLLVNLCSVQEQTNIICLEASEHVLGIHPLFGRRTPHTANKTCLVTHRVEDDTKFYNEQDKVFRFFQTFNNCKIIQHKPIGGLIDGAWHDKLMARSHQRALQIAELAKPMVDDLKDIPVAFLPTTVTKMIELVKQLDDMPDGTRESINANEYLDTK